jgi:hypothetical protein
VVSQAIYVAAALGIADRLAAGPGSLRALAISVGEDAYRALGRPGQSTSILEAVPTPRAQRGRAD